MNNETDTRLEIIAEKPASTPRNTPLLFIHGMCHAAWCWQEYFLPYFAGHGYVAYALSLQGHGQSESKKPLRSVSIADYVSDISRAVNKIDRPPVLIGHSLGGLVVQKYVETHQVPAAVLMASVPPQGLLASTVRFALRRPGASLRMFFTMSLYPMVENPKHCRNLLFSDSMPEKQVKKYQARMQDESFRAYWDGLVLNLPRPGRVRTPIFVLGAADDNVIAVNEIEHTAQAYGTEAEILPDMAHDMMLESGWKNAADRILDWLNDAEIE